MRITMLGMPTHPSVKKGSPRPTSIPTAAMAMSSAPQPPVVICLGLATDNTGVRKWRMSSKAKMERLKQQLPRRVPKAKSGECTSTTELTEVTSSGMVVTNAISTTPIHIRPSPVFSAITSPYRASFVPANKITARQIANLNQIKARSSSWAKYGNHTTW